MTNEDAMTPPFGPQMAFTAGSELRPEAITPGGRWSAPLALLKERGFTWAVQVLWQHLCARWQLRRCSSLGKWVRVYGRMRVHNEGSIAIGDHVRFLAHSAMSELVTWEGGRIEIGDGTAFGYGTSISAASKVTVGANCMVGTHVNIMDCTFHNEEDRSWSLEPEPITIEDNVWLGNRCMIMKGVRIGEGAVVAACSLVTRDVPPRTTVMGVPARVVSLGGK